MAVTGVVNHARQPFPIGKVGRDRKGEWRANHPISKVIPKPVPDAISRNRHLATE